MKRENKIGTPTKLKVRYRWGFNNNHSKYQTFFKKKIKFYAMMLA
jgi:hypothetical protein